MFSRLWGNTSNGNGQKSPKISSSITITQNLRPPNSRRNSSLNVVLSFVTLSPILLIWPSGISGCFRPSRKHYAVSGSVQTRKPNRPATPSCLGSLRRSFQRQSHRNGQRDGRPVSNTKDDTLKKIKM